MLAEIIRPHAHAIKADADAGMITAQQIITNYRIWKVGGDGGALQRADDLLRLWKAEKAEAAKQVMKATPPHRACHCGAAAHFGVGWFFGRAEGKWLCREHYKAEAV